MVSKRKAPTSSDQTNFINRRRENREREREIDVGYHGTQTKRAAEIKIDIREYVTAVNIKIDRKTGISFKESTLT